ncbi:30S ribosomal protein S20 [Rickettsia endosymbiont of Gonocerus acuteangulatus]|uniref:30S ribosomal protein S20 n=1 Tax=Rickettsia endosymbiont of Gonocerus acuteangulatus TaxID=3066266 RepID=UPI003132C6DC
MANHSSAKKAARQTVKKTLVNKRRASAIKTFVKKVLHEINQGNKEKANSALVIAQSKIMQGVKKNIIKLNTASRKISKLSKKIKTMN